MQKQSNIEALKKKGVLSNAAAKSLEKSGGVSKRNSTPTYIFLTKDKKEVTPMLYMRGGKGTTSAAAFAVGGHPPYLAVTEEYTAAGPQTKTVTTG